MTPKEKQEQVRTGSAGEDMSSMGTIREQMGLGAGKLQKVARVLHLSLTGQSLGQ